MKNQIILVAVIALLIGGIGGYIISHDEGYERGWMMGGWGDRDRDRDEQKFTANDDDSSGMGSMHDMHGMGSATTERSFIEEMIPHHQEAIDTAKQVIARGGTTPEIKKLAEGIVTAQEKEIADMKSWYQSWYGTEYKDDGKYKSMMRDLSALSGKELDKAFLEDMIMHHMGALMMAQAVSQHIEHKEVQTLAQNIASSQSEEVITMRILLKQI
jgi:uncharacterized protein (DUF305 family)